ncbi:peptidylprolyl isomerase [Ningiella sp. W23]|uniref:peptidylprolyl isomerase n=1 Tax=Ningiella sp. W23 TaxID=3023715 RepID=UPI003757210D
MNFTRYSTLFALSFLLLVAPFTRATVVEVRTVLGDFQVNLFDDTTPETVENFLEYVNSGAYANNVIHRGVPNFIIQMGGFQYNNSIPFDTVPTGVPVVNEPVLSNVRGTLAMAKLSGDPNSATSQFFVNLANNSGNLDVQNGGFTVFGQVLDNGMEVVDAIAELRRVNLDSGTFSEVPLRNFSDLDVAQGTIPDGDNFVLVTDVVVIDNTRITNPNLNPVRNTLLNAPPTPTPNNPSSDGGGGGSTSVFFLGLMGVIAYLRMRFNR